MTQTVSVIVRTLNESRFLDELLESVGSQHLPNDGLEVIVVDSGSTDGTLEIAQRHGCRITTIDKSDFTFGRSLNRGCECALGSYLVFVSGHCIPTHNDWLTNLIAPLKDGIAEYSYGRQIGRDGAKFGEQMLFRKYFPNESRLPQKGYFCNNANAALTRESWLKHRFNEELTGLEDMYLAKQIVAGGGSIAYVAEAPVYHIHNETWKQVRIRFERESLALRDISPQLNFSLIDLAHFFVASVASDFAAAWREGVWAEHFSDIVGFRAMQYWGTYRGHHEHRKLTKEMKLRYFYPGIPAVEDDDEANCVAATESQQ